MSTGTLEPVGTLRPRYGTCVGVWLVFALGPPMLALVLIGWWTSSVCDAGSTDCSWGFEFLLAVPVAIAGLFLIAPTVLYVWLRRVGDPLAGTTVRRTLIVAALNLVVVFTPVTGPPIFVVPPLIGRWWALRSRSDTTEPDGPTSVRPPVPPPPPPLR